MHRELQDAYNLEMLAAIAHYRTGDLEQSFYHLERAHILGQSYCLSHARAHWWMLKVGWKRRDPIEITGQMARIIGALIFSRIWVPIGNTGGAHVSPFSSMPIPEEFRLLLSKHGPSIGKDRRH